MVTISDVVFKFITLNVDLLFGAFVENTIPSLSHQVVYFLHVEAALNYREILNQILVSPYVFMRYLTKTLNATNGHILPVQWSSARYAPGLHV